MNDDPIIGPVELHGRCGYLNLDGRFAIAPHFEELGLCSEGMVSFVQADRVGFLDVSGAIAIPARFDAVDAMPTFNSGLAAVRSNGLVGYIDRRGDWRILPKWDWGWNFVKEYVLTECTSGYRILDKSGTVLSEVPVHDIPRRMDWVASWDCFRALFGSMDGVREGCLNWRGSIVFPPVHRRLTDFYGNVAGFSDEEDSLDARFGLTTLDGKILKKPDYLDLGEFSEGLASAARTCSSAGVIEHYGYIDTEGNWVIEPRFGHAWAFHEGVARVATGGMSMANISSERPARFGYINRHGDWVVEPVLSSATDFRRGFALVRGEGGIAVIDKGGRVVCRPAAG